MPLSFIQFGVFDAWHLPRDNGIGVSPRPTAVRWVFVILSHGPPMIAGTSEHPTGTHPSIETEMDRRAARNHLLEALPQETRELLTPHLERVTLEIGDTLARAGEPWAYLYLPEGASISVLRQMENGMRMEVGTIGNEGIVGLPALLGADACDADAIAPIPGPALRVPVPVVRAIAETHRGFLEVVHRYTQAYLTQVAQNAACNHLHKLEQRCARWLLMTHDRAGGLDVIPLKHEYLAMMFGVHRPAISLAVGALQDRGLIAYQRGRMHLVDRVGLEGAACECYRLVRQQFDQLVS